MRLLGLGQHSLQPEPRTHLPSVDQPFQSVQLMRTGIRELHQVLLHAFDEAPIP